MDAGMTRADAPVEPGRVSGGRRLALIGVAVVTLAVAGVRRRPRRGVRLRLRRRHRDRRGDDGGARLGRSAP